MFLGKFAKTPGKFVARFRHRAPPSGDFLQVVFLADAQGDRSINAEQLSLQIAGFSVEWGAKIRGYFTDPSVRLMESGSRQFQNIRCIKTGAHAHLCNHNNTELLYVARLMPVYNIHLFS